MTENIFSEEIRVILHATMLDATFEKFNVKFQVMTPLKFQYDFFHIILHNYQ
jgi:hypothetical protein